MTAQQFLNSFMKSLLHLAACQRAMMTSKTGAVCFSHFSLLQLHFIQICLVCHFPSLLTDCIY